MSSAAGPSVMLILRDLGIGGIQENALTMAKYLPRVGCRTVVCTFADGPLRADLERLGVPVEVLPTRRHSVVSLPRYVAEMLRLRRELADLLVKHRVDVVQARGLGSLNFLVMTLRFGRRVRVWWSIENAVFMVKEEHQLRHRWLYRPKLAAHRVLYRHGARLVDGVIAVSEETERSFRQTVGYDDLNLAVVPNAVDVERYPATIDRPELRRRLGFAPGDHVMTMVGTFKPQKGHRFLVEAASAIMGDLPDLRLLLVGDGALAGEVRAQVEAAGLSDRIRFLGSRRDVPELLAASDSFVLPSLWEGLPVALIEAMAGGLPVIATAVSGTKQVMVDGRTGWVVPPGDSPALASAMVRLVSDPAAAAAMGAAGRQRAAAWFGAQRQAERLASLFGLGERTPARAHLRWPARAGTGAR